MLLTLLRRLWRWLRRARPACGGPEAVYHRWLATVMPGVDVLAIVRRRPCGCCRVQYVWLTRRRTTAPPVCTN